MSQDIKMRMADTSVKELRRLLKSTKKYIDHWRKEIALQQQFINFNNLDICNAVLKRYERHLTSLKSNYVYYMKRLRVVERDVTWIECHRLSCM